MKVVARRFFCAQPKLLSEENKYYPEIKRARGVNATPYVFCIRTTAAMQPEGFTAGEGMAQRKVSVRVFS